MKQRILVVSPHPDDETLGAGGTLLKAKRRGDELFWLNLTDMRPEYGYDTEIVSRRQDEIITITEQFGFTELYNLGFKPAGLDEYPRSELIREMARIISKVSPDTVILPFKNDVHSDHRIVFEAGLACTKIFRYPTVRRVLMMEVISETDFADSERGFIPNYFVDISDWMDKKIELLKVYRSEIHNPPFPRSELVVRALGTVRGAAAGCRYAEGFQLVKMID